ncbi:MAG: hypothetical protein ACRDO9_04075, partial [Gaiellales bacterium]
DGTRQLIPVSPTAQVIVNGRFATLAGIPLRLNAITIRDGDQPATSVRVTGIPKSTSGDRGGGRGARPSPPRWG